MAFATAPALNADDLVALVEDVELEGFHDPPLETAIDILLPVGQFEVRLLLREQEWVDASVQMGILSRLLALAGLIGPEALTREAEALRVTMMIGHTGRYFEIKRADKPLPHCQ